MPTPKKSLVKGKLTYPRPPQSKLGYIRGGKGWDQPVANPLTVPMTGMMRVNTKDRLGRWNSKSSMAVYTQRVRRVPRRPGGWTILPKAREA